MLIEELINKKGKERDRTAMIKWKRVQNRSILRKGLKRNGKRKFRYAFVTITDVGKYCSILVNILGLRSDVA